MGIFLQLRYVDNMTQKQGMKRLTPERLRQLRGDTSPEALSEAIGMSRSYIRKFEKGLFFIEKSDVLNRIASALGISTDTLLGAEPKSSADAQASPRSEVILRDASIMGVRPLHVRWRAQAGSWVEVDQDQSEIEEHLVPVSIEHPRVTRFLARIYGDSMNKTPLQDGAIAICLDFDELGKPPMDGMIVLVQRTEDGGSTIETTVKRLQVFKDRIELRPESTNPKHETIVVKIGSGEDQEIRIIGVVDGVYYPRRALL